MERRGFIGTVVAGLAALVGGVATKKAVAKSLEKTKLVQVNSAGMFIEIPVLPTKANKSYCLTYNSNTKKAEWTEICGEGPLMAVDPPGTSDFYGPND